MGISFDKHQKLFIVIIVAIAMIVTATTVFLITRCSYKSDKKENKATSVVKTTTSEESTTVKEVTLYVNDEEGANLREKPDKKSELVDTLGFGTKVTSIATEGDWTHVKTVNKEGYVLTKLLSEEKEFKKEEKKTKKKKTDIQSADGTGKVICIDPGHQTKQNTSKEPIGPGAKETKAKVTSGTSGKASGLSEYQLNLQVAMKLKTALEGQGYKVVMTRETNNVNISNSERAQIANKAKADAFIRIHANGGGGREHGIMTLCPSSNNPYCSKISSKSQKLSRCILNNMVKATGAKKLMVSERDDMTGINWSKVPVTIVEMGYMTNAEEDKKMATKSYQDKLVDGMVNGLAEYFK